MQSRITRTPAPINAIVRFINGPLRTAPIPEREIPHPSQVLGVNLAKIKEPKISANPVTPKINSPGNENSIITNTIPSRKIPRTRSRQYNRQRCVRKKQSEANQCCKPGNTKPRSLQFHIRSSNTNSSNQGRLNDPVRHPFKPEWFRHNQIPLNSFLGHKVFNRSCSSFCKRGLPLMISAAWDEFKTSRSFSVSGANASCRSSAPSALITGNVKESSNFVSMNALAISGCGLFFWQRHQRWKEYHPSLSLASSREFPASPITGAASFRSCSEDA